jgi:hypothetical protein
MKRLPIDSVWGVDPGYSTQGIAVLTADGKLQRYSASITGPSLDLHQRALYQVNQILRLMHDFPGNKLLVVEEYHVNKVSKSSPVAVYSRGWYDGLVRAYAAQHFRWAITAHALNVRQWSMPEEKGWIHTKKGKKRKNPTPREIRAYLSTWWPYPLPVEDLYDYQAYKNAGDSVQGKKAAEIHATDALVMAAMGFVCCVQPTLLRGRTARQQGWVHHVHDAYDFEQTAQAR